MHNPNEKTIGFYQSLRDTAPTFNLGLTNALALIRKPDAGTASLIEKIRDKETPAEERRKLKESLPALTFSSTGPKRAFGNHTAYSGWICLDFDKVKDFETTWDALCDDHHSVAVFLSPSGNGFKVVCAVDLPKPLPKPVWDATWLSVAEYYSKLAEVDMTCKDPTRLCFVSSDSQLFERDMFDAEVFPAVVPMGVELAKPDFSADEFSGPVQIVEAKIAPKPGSEFGPDLSDTELIPEGGRHLYFTSLAGKLLAKYTPEKALELLRDVNEKRSASPHDDSDLVRIVTDLTKKDRAAGKVPAVQPEVTAADEAAVEASIATPASSREMPPDGKDPVVAANWMLHNMPLGSPDEPYLMTMEDQSYVWHQGNYDAATEDALNSIVQSIFPMKRNEVTSIVFALRSKTFMPVRDMPYWRENEAPKGYPADPKKIIPLEDCLFDVDAFARGEDPRRPLTPQYVSTARLPIKYEPSATCPRFEKFLDEIWGAKDDRRTMLQHWFGHNLLPDLSQQKIAILFGVPRSGKSTVGKVLSRMLGERNYAAPTFSSLNTPHGMVQMLGKLSAIFCDAHIPHNIDRERSLELLKSISGADPQTINPKFLRDFKATLTVRFTIICNDIPKLNDSSGALIARLLAFRFDKSFLGQEDFGLEAALIKEQSGIFNWALQGLLGYLRRGRLFVSQNSDKELHIIQRQLCPAFAFRDDCLLYPSDLTTDGDAIYRAFGTWAVGHGISHMPKKEILLNEIRNACPNSERVMIKKGAQYIVAMKGLGLQDGIGVPIAREF